MASPNFNIFCGQHVDYDNLDKSLLDKLGLEQYPNYDNCGDSKIIYDKYKEHYMRCLVQGSLCEHNRERYFYKLHPLNNKIDKSTIRSINSSARIDDDVTSIPTDKSEENEIKYNIKTPNGLSKLNFEDPNLLKYYNCEQLKNFDHMPYVDAYRQYYVKYMKCMLLAKIIETYREKIFDKLRSLQPR